jgi:hypothetical protein
VCVEKTKMDDDSSAAVDRFDLIQANPITQHDDSNSRALLTKLSFDAKLRDETSDLAWLTLSKEKIQSELNDLIRFFEST